MTKENLPQSEGDCLRRFPECVQKPCLGTELIDGLLDETGRFIGRDLVSQALGDNDIKMVVFAGEPGSGKSSLAGQFGNMIEKFSEGKKEISYIRFGHLLAQVQAKWNKSAYEWGGAEWYGFSDILSDTCKEAIDTLSPNQLLIGDWVGVAGGMGMDHMDRGRSTLYELSRYSIVQDSQRISPLMTVLVAPDPDTRERARSLRPTFTSPSQKLETIEQDLADTYNISVIWPSKYRSQLKYLSCRERGRILQTIIDRSANPDIITKVNREATFEALWMAEKQGMHFQIPQDEMPLKLFYLHQFKKIYQEYGLPEGRCHIVLNPYTQRKIHWFTDEEEVGYLLGKDEFSADAA